MDDMSHSGQRADAAHEHRHKEMGEGAYRRLVLMAILSFLAMFLLMYAMVDRPANVLLNLNQAYMAALMAAPMVLIELALMGHMYRNRNWNFVTIAASLVILCLSFLAIRQQAGVGDVQFVRSMIPHHAGAVLMCEKAPVRDAEIRGLCQNIIASQRAEIAQMRKILRRLEG